MPYNLSKKICLTFILLLILFIISCKNSDENIDVIEITNYLKPEIFIDYDYIFLNEGLNKPTTIKINQLSSELYVLDNGNNCIYSFSNQGIFLKRIGRPGQGPGDLLGPRFFDIDNSGNIYVYESKNMRISILNNNGKYIGGFRLRWNTQLPFSLNANQEIVMNSPNNGFYITEYSPDGEIKNTIGEIPNLNKKIPGVNKLFAEGWPFVINGNYYIFLQHMTIAKIYDKYGNFMEVKEIDFIPELNLLGYIPPEKHTLLGPGGVTKFLYESIICRNNIFYILVRSFYKDPKEEKEYIIYTIISVI